MPTISWFYGIAVCMYYDDHNPPHFHVFYGEHEAQVAIETGEILRGKLPKRAARLTREWALERQAALLHNWERAQAGKLLERIAGLDAD